MPPKKARIDVAGTSTGRVKKKGATSNPHGIVFKDARQRKRYETLDERPVITTRYPFNHNDFVTHFLKIESNVKMLINNLGWMSFLEPAPDTYLGITLEFLSSLNFVEAKGPNDIHQLSFRLFNDDFEFSLAEFGELIGCSHEGSIHDSKNPALRPGGFNDDEFWGLITGESRYVAREAKASRIHNPVFRYMHKIMACTLFARGETGGVRAGELFLLWAMVHEHPVNTTYYLVNHLASVAAQGKGAIAVGGMVSFIAEKLGFDDKLAGLEKLEGGDQIDLEYCLNSHMIEKVSSGTNKSNKYYLLISRQRSIELPNPARTDTRNLNNWLYHLVPIVERQPVAIEQEEEELVGQGNQNAQPAPNFNMQEWCAKMEAEQVRHGIALQQMREDHILHGQQMEQIREDQILQGQQMENMTGMLQSLMAHFNINQAPPGQQ